MKRRRLLRFPLLVAAVAGLLSITLSAFTPSPGAHGLPAAPPTDTPSASPTEVRRDPNDPAGVEGYLERLQRATPKQRKCSTPGDGRRTTARRDGPTRWCFERIDPAEAPRAPARSKIQRNTADPTPPQQLCSQRPGQTNYDRFHACYEDTGRLVNEDTGAVGAIVRYDVWATLKASSSTWSMQVGVTATDMSPDLFQAAPHFVASLTCPQNLCEKPDPQKKRIFPNTYTYYELPTSIPGNGNIRYTNPTIILTLNTDHAWPGNNVANPLNDPFNIRCDKETYIGGHGCVFYMGNNAAGILYIDYKDPHPRYGDYREVTKHNLYAIEVRDNIKHYGHIGYGNPLHRIDPNKINQNRRKVCTPAFQQKASSLGLSCDEYPYASSEEGGTTSLRRSCAFLPGPQNSAHGNALENALYKPNRILPSYDEGGKYIPGDPYWVWVLNAPPKDKIPAVKQCDQY